MRLIDSEDAINQVAMIAKVLAKSDKQKALCGRIIYMLEHRPTVNATSEPVGNSEELKEPCKDCISRKAVLNAIIKELCIKDENYLLKSEKTIYDVVKNIPSVTPQEPKAGWISVSERLPKDGETVIASVKGGVYPEASYVKGYGWEWAYESGADYWEELEDVIAWMPLPKPYEESEE